MGVMIIPYCFKIKSKADTKTFVNICMINRNSYHVKINDNFAIFFEKDRNGNVSVLEKYGDVYDPFNPSVEVANTENNYYDKTVYYYIWIYRKYINKKWFSN